MILYNKKFEIIKIIDKIDDKRFSPLSLTTDNDRIFICDSFNQKILMTDLDLNLIRQYGEYGNEEDKVKYPNGLCYYKHALYISDRANSRIVKLTNYLKYLTSFSVDFQPSVIKIVNDIACIKSANTNSIHFYDLLYPPYFNFKCQYDEHYGTISILNSKFYEFNNKNGKLYCFNKNGELEESLILKTYKYELRPDNEAVFYEVAENLIMNCPADKMIIRF